MRSINQRIIERLEGLNAQQRREVLTMLEDIAPQNANAKPKTSRRARRRKTPGELFWDRLVNEGLYDGDGGQQYRARLSPASAE
jgi:hypothetical protein